VEPLIPDIAAAPMTRDADDGAFGRALDDLYRTLDGANGAEDRFAAGRGTLQDAAYERARADVALSVATAAAQRLASAVQSVLNTQL
jgi:flagellar hook-basal body complex protein FliE